MFEINFLCELLVRPFNSRNQYIQTGCIELAKKTEKKRLALFDETRLCKIGNDDSYLRVAVQVKSEFIS